MVVLVSWIQSCFFWQLRDFRYLVLACILTHTSVTPKQDATSIASRLQGLDSPSSTQMNWSAGRAPAFRSDLSREERRQGKARFDRHQTAAVAADPPSKIPITSKLVDAVRVS